VKTNARKLDNAIDDSLNRLFSYAGLEGLSRGKLWRDPVSGLALETPQYFFMRAACGPATNVRATILLYRQLAGDPNHHMVVEDIRQDPILGPPAPPGAIDDTQAIPFRPLAAGMGQAVAERTILRKQSDGDWETWGDVANRVAYGIALLASTPEHSSKEEYRLLRSHLAKATTLMSGRHLQHGDRDQPQRGMEIFTNCLHGDTTLAQRVGTTVSVRCADGQWRSAIASSYGRPTLYT
jgi:ribonucleotide reductase alpha subunit